MPQQSIFHLAIPVSDLTAARQFYGGLLGCREGRSTEHWIDFDFFGHQLTVHLGDPLTVSSHSEVDGKKVPALHFGLLLSRNDWDRLSERLTAAGTVFDIEPHIRYPGKPGEQATMFFRDPAGNAIEIKSFSDPGEIFAAD